MPLRVFHTRPPPRTTTTTTTTTKTKNNNKTEKPTKPKQTNKQQTKQSNKKKTKKKNPPTTTKKKKKKKLHLEQPFSSWTNFCWLFKDGFEDGFLIVCGWAKWYTSLLPHRCAFSRKQDVGLCGLGKQRTLLSAGTHNLARLFSLSLFAHTLSAHLRNVGFTYIHTVQPVKRKSVSMTDVSLIDTGLGVGVFWGWGSGGGLSCKTSRPDFVRKTTHKQLFVRRKYIHDMSFTCMPDTCFWFRGLTLSSIWNVRLLFDKSVPLSSHWSLFLLPVNVLWQQFSG